MIAHWRAAFAANYLLKCSSLIGVRPFFDNNLASTVSFGNFSGELRDEYPVETRERSIVEVPVHNRASKKRVARSVCTGLFELAATVNIAIAITERAALKHPLIRHIEVPHDGIRDAQTRLTSSNVQSGGNFPDLDITVGRITDANVPPVNAINQLGLL